MVNVDTERNVPNPAGLDGIEFVEFATAEPGRLGRHLEMLGFTPVARHRSKNVLLYRQGAVNFIVNGEQDGHAQHFVQQYGAGICALALRVKDAAQATRYVSEHGGWEVESAAGVMELRIPAFQGVGGSLIYLVDRYQDHSIYDVDFVRLASTEAPSEAPLLDTVDQVVQCIQPGRFKAWQEFYTQLFGFQPGGVQGDGAGLIESPCGKVRIRLETLPGERGDSGEEGFGAVRLLAPDLAFAAEALARRGLNLSESLTPDLYAPRVLHTRREPGLVHFEIAARAN